ncbi:alpha/beta fold hydrolase [Deinococcus planocerae]|uniref:alpha/beta fold hydrolase n=1 Tax=Deinococcus planocerae TaxID=1737569 RepID=UPI001FE8EE31|nr:alpha/beta hydrolase [Deinococcus planocerae]
MRQRLEGAGHTVVTPDLPGHGADQTPEDEVTLDACTRAVVRAVGDRMGVVLVGHSFGGVVTAQVAEHLPERVGHLVYLAAPVLPDGQSNAEVSQGDPASLLNPNAVLEDGMIRFPTEWIGPGLCNDCTPQDVRTIRERVRPFPPGLLLMPVHLTPERFGRVPKYDLLAARDQTVSYGFQRATQARLAFAGSHTLDASHMPMLSRPDELVAILQSL